MNDSESLKRIHMYKNKRIIYTYSTLIQRKEECKQQYADFFLSFGGGWVMKYMQKVPATSSRTPPPPKLDQKILTERKTKWKSVKIALNKK